MEWCAFEFRLVKPEADGASLREHLLAIPERLRDPEVTELLAERPAPSRFMYLFDAFVQIARSRRSGFERPESLGPEQIYYWLHVGGFPLHAWEVDVIYRIDDEWFKVFSPSKKKDTRRAN